MSSYHAGILVLFGLTFILSCGFSFSYNLAGMANLSYVAAYGVGAYSYAIAADKNLPLIAIMAIAVVLSLVFGFGLGRLTSSVRSDEFALITLAVLVVFQILLKNLNSLTNGPLGMSISQEKGFGELAISNVRENAILTLVVAGLIALFFLIMHRMRAYVIVRALRDDELVLQTMGYDIGLVKACVSAISFVAAGIAGTLYASYLLYVDPSSFSVGALLPILFVVALTGSNSNIAKIAVFSAVVVAAPELIKLLDVPDQKLGALQQLIFAIPLVLILAIQGRRMRTTHD